MIFRGAEGQPSFDITIQVAGHVVSEADARGQVVEIANTDGVAEVGWVLPWDHLNADVLVNEPGVYRLYLITPGGEQYLATVSIVNICVPPYPAGILGALASGYIRRAVRLELGCRGDQVPCEEAKAV